MTTRHTCNPSEYYPRIESLEPRYNPATTQAFDVPGAGTAFELAQFEDAPPPQLIPGGPTGSGRFLRLASGNPTTPPNSNAIAFNRTDAGTFGQIVIEFDFRITPGTGRADGFGVAILSTANFGISGAVGGTAEEANFGGSIGIGFDVFQNAGDINNNHVSVHFDGATPGQFDATPLLNLASGQFIHARVIVRPAIGLSDITVQLAPVGGVPMTLVDRFDVSGLAPFEGRLQVTARSGGLAADHDIDNISMQSFLAPQAIPGVTAGVRVAQGDMNGDGTADFITSPGPGVAPHVKVFNGLTGEQIRSFFAYDPAFTGGVFVASGDVNGDGRDDIITGPGAGGVPHIKVFDGGTGAEIRSFFAYDAAFTGGVFVAAGDINDDGRVDIVTGSGAGGGPHVKVFDGITNADIRSFFAYDPLFMGGVTVAAGNVDNDRGDDIITGAATAGLSHVKAFDGDTGAEIRSFFAYDPTFTGGVFVATGDTNADGFADIITGAGVGGGPHVKVFDGRDESELDDFFAYDPLFAGGVSVAGRNGGKILTGAGPGGGPHVNLFDDDFQLDLSFFAYDPGFGG